MSSAPTCSLLSNHLPCVVSATSLPVGTPAHHTCHVLLHQVANIIQYSTVRVSRPQGCPTTVHLLHTCSALSAHLACAVPATSTPAGTRVPSTGPAWRTFCASMTLRHGAFWHPHICLQTVYCTLTCSALSNQLPYTVSATSMAAVPPTPAHHTDHVRWHPLANLIPHITVCVCRPHGVPQHGDFATHLQRTLRTLGLHRACYLCARWYQRAVNLPRPARATCITLATHLVCAVSDTYIAATTALPSTLLSAATDA